MYKQFAYRNSLGAIVKFTAGNSCPIKAANNQASARYIISTCKLPTPSNQPILALITFKPVN